MVGRNGVGKSMLAQLLAGLRMPSAGQCRRIGHVHYMGQQVQPRPGQRVAELAAVDATLAALRRVEEGGVAQSDFDLIGEQWVLRDLLQQSLSDAGLHGVEADTPVEALSGGQRMRVALVGALLQPADLLILDEPSNHLDAAGRQWLAEQLRRRRRGYLVISHDRLLLEQVEQIVELSSQGLRSYGGNYTRYAELRGAEKDAADELLRQKRHERRKGEQELQRQRQQLEQRSARGRRGAAGANQAPILLGLQRQRAQATFGRASRQLQQHQQQLDDAVRYAQAGIDEPAPLLLAPVPQAVGPEWVVRMEAVRLPWAPASRPALDLTLRRGQRLAVTGDNGGGKSTLLNVLAGKLPVAEGRVQISLPTALLDQQLAMLPAESTALEALRCHNAELDEASLRSRLSLLGLDATQAQLPVSQLSGGQRLKAALACAVYAAPAAQLLLLDEPANHLDLEALLALETLLRQYQGTLVVVAHDARFLEAIGTDSRLHIDKSGWHFEA